jgi:16S rRNA (cytosine967-C5)-methyltransferase
VRETQETNPRRLAFDVLMAVERGGFADAELGRRLSRADLERRDQALATRLVYGTLAWQGYLDHVLAGASRRGTLDTPVRIILRLALFQLLKLTRVPDHAAVDTAVELAKSVHASAGGFVNAVLRRILREGTPATLPGDNDAPAVLALTWSHPEWLVRLWLDELGLEETRALLAVDNGEAPTVLRVNRMRATRPAMLDALASANITARAGAYAPDAIVLDDGVDPQRLPGFADGQLSIQGEASQLVALLVGARPGDTVWDTCAAPGGKATSIAEQMRGEGQLIATDVNESGIAQLRQMSQRLRLANIRGVVADAAGEKDLDDVPQAVDVALVDAPCSGFGTLRQHPEIRWRRTPADLIAAAQRQRTLLDAAARRVRRGGALVYATCTTTRIENDDVITDFLDRHAEFTIVDPRALLPSQAHVLVDGARLRTWPHRHGLDGFFAVRLARAG